MTQIAADVLGLPIENVTFKLGDSALPEAPVEGGSFTVSSVGSAVKTVCEQVRTKLFKLARKIEGSPLGGAKMAEVKFADGKICLRRESTRAVSLTEAMRYGKVDALEMEATSKTGAKQQHYSRYTHSAVFAEVKIDEDFGTVQVARVVSAVAGGHILNPKTARSQVLARSSGASAWQEWKRRVYSIMPLRAVYMNHNLAEVPTSPVNVIVHDIDVIFIEEDDSIVDPSAPKGWARSALSASQRQSLMRSTMRPDESARSADNFG